jgi:hypothetical protein
MVCTSDSWLKKLTAFEIRERAKIAAGNWEQLTSKIHR